MIKKNKTLISLFFINSGKEASIAKIFFLNYKPRSAKFFLQKSLPVLLLISLVGYMEGIVSFSTYGRFCYNNVEDWCKCKLEVAIVSTDHEIIHGLSTSNVGNITPRNLWNIIHYIPQYRCNRHLNKHLSSPFLKGGLGADSSKTSW